MTNNVERLSNLLVIYKSFFCEVFVHFLKSFF